MSGSKWNELLEKYLWPWPAPQPQYFRALRRRHRCSWRSGARPGAWGCCGRSGCHPRGSVPQHRDATSRKASGTPPPRTWCSPRPPALPRHSLAGWRSEGAHDALQNTREREWVRVRVIGAHCSSLQMDTKVHRWIIATIDGYILRYTR